MVNYRLVLLLTAVANAAAAPVDCETRHFDQRQNGTENYRLNIDGVVIAVAPAESLLSAASDLDLSELLDLDNYDEELFKPKPPNKPSSTLIEPKPEDIKPDSPTDLKPQEPMQQPDKPVKPAEASLSDVSLSNDINGQKKDVDPKKREKAKRLKNRLASILLPLLRRTRHH